ncbi:MAG: hypothetical protein ACLSBH_05995 [Coprobacillus cateniformis]
MKEDYQFKGCWIKGPDRDYGQDDSLYYQDQRNTVVLKQFSIRDRKQTYIYILQHLDIQLSISMDKE